MSWAKKKQPTTYQKQTNRRQQNNINPLLLLWLPLCCWPKRFLLGCSRVLGLGLQGAWRFLSFGLQGTESKYLAVLVTLVQRFELVDKRGCAVSLEAFVPATHWAIVSKPARRWPQLLVVCLLTLFCWWLCLHLWASSPHLDGQTREHLSASERRIDAPEIVFSQTLPNLAYQWQAGCPLSCGRPSAGKHNISVLPQSRASSSWSLCRPSQNTWQSHRWAPPPVWHRGSRLSDDEPGRSEWSWRKQEQIFLGVERHSFGEKKRFIVLWF